MTWLVWRQHRRQIAVTLVALAGVAAVMIPTGLAMHHEYGRSGLAVCLARLGDAPLIHPSEAAAGCERLSHQFQRRYNGLAFVGVLFVILPVLAGLFFGAPLVAREVEQGTHRLVWTQGVSRRRWALTKFGLVGAVTAVLAVGYAVGVSWWFGPLVTASGGRLGYLSFDVQGVVPVAYTLFAVALGILAGTLWRRTVPAMGAALIGFAVVRIGVETLARPRFMAPETLTFSPQGALEPNPAAGDWVYAEGVRDAAGRLVASGSELGPCPTGGCGDALGQGAYNWRLYQPGTRFWTFQAIEAGIFLALAAVLVALAVARVQKIS